MGVHMLRGVDRARAGRVARYLVLGGAVAVLVVNSAANAQEPPPGDTLRGDSPRAAMRGYLEATRAGDHERAARYLDLRHLPPERRAKEGTRLASQLKYALDRSLWVELDSLSDEPPGRADDGLPEGQDLVGTVESREGPVDVRLARMPGDEPPHWRIAASTVRNIPALHAAFGPSPIEERLPQTLREGRWLELAPWQWIGLVALALASIGVAFPAVFVLLRVARRVIRRGVRGLDPELLSLARRPLRLSIAVALFAAALHLLALPVPAERFLRGASRGLLVVTAVWLALRVVDGVARQMDGRFRLLGKLSAAAAIPLARRVIKALMLLIAAIAIAANLGINVTGVVAGLGIGGLAVALAAQKTMENLFGGLTLITDQPVRAGDFCRVGGWSGTVEDVGLRSTRIRTLDRTVVTIPNAAFAGMELENFTRRDRIWFHPILNLRYETTPDQLRWLLIALKRLLASHPMVSPEPARVRFVALGAHSLDLEVFAYIETNDFDQFLAVQEDLLLRIMDLVGESGSGFAFPSQTLYVAPAPSVDPERSASAAEQVATWRARGEMPLPWAPPERLEEWRGSLDYPPEGAAVRERSRS